jgi:transcriptional regulator EpsA
MQMDLDVKSYYLNKLFSAIKRSNKVKKHIDFFLWLQTSVAELIPHDALMAIWGDFNESQDNSRLQYDVASNIDGFNTRVVIGISKDVNQCMNYLYQLWLENNRQFYVLNNFGTSEFDCKFRKIFPDLPQELNSLLVFGISDLRGGNDCLYVFFSKFHKFQIKSTVMDFMMPHIDYVLRKIQHLGPLKPLVKASPQLNMSSLTERELEVIEWIKAGKTNHEIAAILSITQNTVKSHLKRVYQKLNVSKRAQAVALLARP